MDTDDINPGPRWPEYNPTQPEPDRPAPEARSADVSPPVRPSATMLVAVALLAGAVGAVLSGGPIGSGGDSSDRLDLIEESIRAVVSVQVEGGPEGSGVFLGDDGYLVTNAHVVGDSDTVTIVDFEGSRQNAIVVGSDRTSDVAVLRVGTNRNGGLELRDLRADPVRIGEEVVAVGSPFGFASSVTEGIISGVGRNLRMGPQDLLTSLLQTDAAIQPGNSGGPLLDEQGRVVGLNSAIASTTGRGQGFGFSIPADTVAGVMADILAIGYVRYAQMGVMITETPDMEGALVAGVTDGSGASVAGLQQGDLIVHANGTIIRDSAALISIVRRLFPGEDLEIRVLRGEDVLEMNVKLGESAPASSGR